MTAECGDLVKHQRIRYSFNLASYCFVILIRSGSLQLGTIKNYLLTGPNGVHLILLQILIRDNFAIKESGN